MKITNLLLIIFLLFLISITIIYYDIIFQSQLFKIMHEWLIDNLTLIKATTTLFVLGTLIGWKFLFSIVKNPSTLKEQIANIYIIFIVSIINHATVPKKFIILSLFLGSILGRNLIIFVPIEYPNSLIVILFAPFLFFIFNLSIFYGYFLLCLQYPKIFGKYLIDFLKKNANKEVLSIIGLSKKKQKK